jgi:hypothetical protein
LLTTLTFCKSASIVEPSLDIRVARNGTAYEFSFTTCGGSLGRSPFEVSEIVVFKGAGRADTLPIQCEFTKDNPSVHNLRQWQYSATTPGFTIANCEPLKPGVTYQVHAGAGASTGRRVFVLRENGDVVLGQNSCH